MKPEYQKHKTITNKNLKDHYPNLHFYLNLYYPIGIKSSNEKYKSYIGQKKLNILIKNNIENSENLKSNWTNGFLKKVSQKTNYDVLGATYGLVPNYGGKIILNQSKDLRYSTELYFFVSLLNYFYSIQIIYSDKFTTYQRDYLPDITGYGLDKIIVSPIDDEFGELFLNLKELIEFEFKGAKFLPFRFDLIKLKDFEVPYEYSRDFCTQISKAFFHKGILLNEKTKIIGNIDYESDGL